LPEARLSIPPDAEHVRMARVVVAAAARRHGLADEQVDDVRLAVGEAVARAVLRHEAAEQGEQVELLVSDDEAGFSVRISDRVDPAQPDHDGGLALELVRALAPVARLDGAVVTLEWPRDR